MAITKKQTEITQATVARGVDKQTHEVFYVVRSNSCETTWYTVRWNNERLQWCCNCPATCSGCKHSRAVNEVLKIRRATIALAMGGQRAERVCDDPFFQGASNVVERDLPPSMKGNLNFSNRREIKTENGCPMR